MSSDSMTTRFSIGLSIVGRVGPTTRKRFTIVVEEMGCHVYSFSRLFVVVSEENLEPPTSYEQLDEYLHRHVYTNELLRDSPHMFQLATDDDELEMAIYFFDDEYVKQQPGRTSFLLHEDWKLPTEFKDGTFSCDESTHSVEPAGSGQGTTYVALLAYYDSGNLYDLEGTRSIQGVRVPDLARHLASSEPDDSWPFELAALRSQMFKSCDELHADEMPFVEAIRKDPNDDEAWAVYSDWLEERNITHRTTDFIRHGFQQMTAYQVSVICNSIDTRGFGKGTLDKADAKLKSMSEQTGHGELDATKSLIFVDEHIAQLCLYTADWGNEDLYHQWIIFDDLWAAANEDLANAILRFGNRWDVLSND